MKTRRRQAIVAESGRPPVRVLTKAECAKARRTLMRRDPVLAAAIRDLAAYLVGHLDDPATFGRTVAVSS